MKSFRALWAAAVAAALALTARSGTASSTSYEFDGAQQVGQLSAAVDRKPVGSITGSITGELLAGGTYQLSAYRGEPVVVNFWGTWCPSCVIATPQFASVYDQYRLKHVAFLGVDIDEAGRDAPKAFVADNHVGYPIAYDETGSAHALST